MKTRENPCESYICEGNCSKGREGTFYKYCQKCNKYKAKKGSLPARTDNRRQKMDRIQKKERYDY